MSLTYNYHISHNQNQNPLLNLLINIISARSAQQLLSLKDGYTFGFSNFLMVDLCNSSAYYWLDIISVLIPPLENLLSKNL